MSKTRKVLYGILLVYVLGLVVFGVAFGVHGHKNESFNVIDAYHLVTWFKIVGPIEFNKGVLYLLIAAALTVGTITWAAYRMESRPGRLQTAVEWAYDLTTRMTRENMDEQMALRWFPVVATLFLFILFTNLIGYIPLPVDTVDTFNLFGLHVPAFQIYAADTNVAVPLLLALGVFIAYNFEGIRHQGPIGYLKSLIPQGVRGAMLALIFPLEIVSNFLRLLSLTIRLWANLLAGHLLIDFMSGALAVLLGLQILGWFTLPIGVLIYMFEAVLIAGLQAFIFAILAAIYLGGAVTRH
ncbi:MAG TPA: F0F1 ATP synthase subunit A [Solirubrobacteraceae bacterium]|nr:F0F1 ATP synthase subunit A [Solirubrobacteraceae bacterium]